ncbi:MAG: hypothetical protein PHN92_12640 [Geobacter sp.]|nr:hypothetical protein [Geobacter sp.]
MSDLVTTNQLMVVLESMRSEIKAVYEGYSVLSNQIAETKVELKEDIALVDAKVMGLAKRVDRVESSLSERIDRVESSLSERIDRVESSLSERIDRVESSLSERIDRVEDRLSAEIAEVRTDLDEHRSNTEMHRAPKRRTLKKAA